MDERFGISAGGRSAEEEFRRLTGAGIAAGAALGDALLEGNPVEVKRATSYTLNQVRAVKYIPIAALYVPTSQWYVIPGHVIVVEAARKRRGQHTENPFESATLSLGRLQHYSVEAGELRQRTLDAIEESGRYPGLRKAMEGVLADSRALADRSVAEVSALVDSLGLARAIVARGAGLSGSEALLDALFDRADQPE